jgi:hypothetical protein
MIFDIMCLESMRFNRRQYIYTVGTVLEQICMRASRDNVLADALTLNCFHCLLWQVKFLSQAHNVYI